MLFNFENRSTGAMQTLVSLMYKLAFARDDPFRRSSVIEDMALSLFNGDAGHYLGLSRDGSWTSVSTGNVKVKARALEMATLVQERDALVEDVQV